MSKSKPTEAIPKHRVLREVYRNYTQFSEYVSSTGKHVIDHGYWIYDDEGVPKDKVEICISYWDLHNGLNELAPRKREAFFYNVILDWKQRDVADKMGITTVSVGQYVEQAMMQLAEHYFAEETPSLKDKLECPECGKEANFEVDDYLCIDCRRKCDIDRYWREKIVKNVEK